MTHDCKPGIKRVIIEAMAAIIEYVLFPGIPDICQEPYDAPTAEDREPQCQT
jgi:hypothetical protein